MAIPTKASHSQAKLGKKKKIVIKKKVQQKKDISEHFKPARGKVLHKPLSSRTITKTAVPANRKVSRPSFTENRISSHHHRNSSPPSAHNAEGDANRASFLMQMSPPTAVQARGRAVRSTHRGDGHRVDRDKEGKLPEERLLQKRRNQGSSAVPKKIEILESIQVGELAKKLNLRPNEVIGRLMRMGEMVTINKTIDAEVATLLATEYDCTVKVISLYEETVIQKQEADEKDKVRRPPVVTIMGHVDHGKTKLLDTICRSNVIDTEAGAITQHIGAYQVDTPRGKITFLDTPGHEAFSAMRARGASVTDIVILVVAADDGVKQQTLEAIAHAKEAKVPIIVAVNKMDLPDADTEKIKKELAGHGLATENWGGDTVLCPISAKENQGIDHLLEMVLLQAEMLNLMANPKLRTIGHVIEAKIDQSKGPVITVLVEQGTLQEGDIYVAGIYAGRVRTMCNDRGQRIQSALPATPVMLTGSSGVPEAGDPFHVVEDEKYGREIASKRQYYKQITNTSAKTKPSLSELGSWVQEHKELHLIIKADVQGSVEAIQDGLLRLSTKDVKVRIVHGATGAISESDVNLSTASNGIVIGFQVRAVPRAIELAERSHIEIKYYSIIYDLIRDIKQAMEGLLDPEKVEDVIGKAEVRQVFKISRMGNAVGCRVVSGLIRKKAQVRVIRDGIVLHSTTIRSLRRVKEDVNEVSDGFECGISLSSFNDFKEGDQLEFFEIKEVARKLWPENS